MQDKLYAGPEHQPFLYPSGPSQALLIHGFLGSPRDVRPLAQELAAAGVTARAVLLPGFGEQIDRLRRAKANDWLETARDAWQEMREGAERATLIGFSMGGAVAVRLAAEAGLAPDQLILLAPHWKFADRRAVVLPLAKHVIRDYKPFGRVDFESPDMREIFSEWVPGSDLDDPTVRDRLRKAAAIPTSALDELRRIGVKAAAAAPRVSAPTTILQGLQDSTTLPGHSRELARRMGADLREFPGDHLIVDPNKPSWRTVRDAVVELTVGPSR